ncbi:putative pre-mRNA splicing factor [Leishmania braziliensis MHOM/BR/75/M2904]|uniref:Pre-mRNA splicing factor n=2 Tax=Leishmania braziliensis TaxID=5660 RepID=A4HDG7_LEIBR|nr:putative pre-mRNA splicing factor [Leishmania braziliensis MHOM/BR/75/M2904]CAJ2473659.1 unnamed protein product [Leishmania braziliensis]CAM42287.1 putative pre-mRNA splicing factor [Leishmania braziliensis MHOM/BR/75/M2904]
MNIFRGLQHYFSAGDGDLKQLLDTRVYVWNIPAGSTTLTDRNLRVGRSTTRSIESTCNYLDNAESNRYIIFNFSPLMMELVEGCRFGQVLDFSKQSVENYGLLMEVCFTIRKWVYAGDTDSGSPVAPPASSPIGGAGAANRPTHSHCAVLAFLEESPAVAHPNYAAMLGACYLIFSGFPTYTGSGTLDFVERELGIPRSVYHAPSQESYLNYFQLLFEIPVLPNPKRLTLTRVSLHNLSSLAERNLGLQLDRADGQAPRLFSDPNAWCRGDPSTLEIYLDLNESVLGDFVLNVFLYDVQPIHSRGVVAESHSSPASSSLVGGALSSSTDGVQALPAALPERALVGVGGAASPPTTRFITGTSKAKKIVQKGRLLRLAFSTIFIHQATHRVRVRDMDYATANALPDDFYAQLHFTECAPADTDENYVREITQRVEQSPQRQMMLSRPDPRDLLASARVGGYRSSSRYAAVEEECHGGVYYRSDGTRRGGGASMDLRIRQERSLPLTGATMLYLPTPLHMNSEDERRFDNDDDVAEAEPTLIRMVPQPGTVARPRQPTPERLYGGGYPVISSQPVDVQDAAPTPSPFTAVLPLPPVSRTPLTHLDPSMIAEGNSPPPRMAPQPAGLPPPPPPPGKLLPPPAPPPKLPPPQPPLTAPAGLPPPAPPAGVPPPPPPPGLLNSNAPPPPPPPPGVPGGGEAAVKPKSQYHGPRLKSFFWKKIPKPSGIWAASDPDDMRRAVIDEPFLLELFKVKAVAQASVAESAVKKLEQERRSNVFTTQRLQNIGIALKRVQVSVEDVCKALITCDSIILPPELRETLTAALPTSEEVTGLTAEKKAGRVVWTDVETYLYTMATTVKDVRERLQLWTAAEELEDAVQSISNLLDSVDAAVCAITQRNGRFARMMRMILAFGNYLNRGTPHADAEGFRLESLNQLNFVKSSDGKTTVLMAFVVSLMDGERSKRERRGSTTSTPSDDDNDVDDARSVLRFVEDVSCIRTVASSPLQDMGQQVSQLNFTLQRMRRVVEEAKDTKVWYDKRLPCVKAEEMPDALPGLLTAAVDRYLARVGQIALRYQELRDDVSAMMATYGEDPNADETVIWGYVLQFSKDVQRCVDTVTATHLTKRRLMRTPEETEQTQSGAKADVAAPPPPSSSGQSSGPRDEVKRTRLPKLVDEDDSGD